MNILLFYFVHVLWTKKTKETVPPVSEDEPLQNDEQRKLFESEEWIAETCRVLNQQWLSDTLQAENT